MSDDVLCDCLPPDHDCSHYKSEHDHDCDGQTFDPPCGGCMRCIVAQIAYYESEAGGREFEEVDRPTPPVPAAEDEDGLLPIEQSLASALWTRWADPEGGPVIVIMDDPRTVARSLREWLAANTRPAPTVNADQVEHIEGAVYGVLTDDTTEGMGLFDLAQRIAAEVVASLGLTVADEGAS